MQLCILNIVPTRPVILTGDCSCLQTSGREDRWGLATVFVPPRLSQLGACHHMVVSIVGSLLLPAVFLGVISTENVPRSVFKKAEVALG